jgi:hypothetical protein
MRVRRRVIGAGLVLVLMVPTGLLAYGPLIPWSPVHSGYDQLTLLRARIPRGQAAVFEQEVRRKQFTPREN